MYFVARMEAGDEDLREAARGVAATNQQRSLHHHFSSTLLHSPHTFSRDTTSLFVLQYMHMVPEEEIEKEMQSSKHLWSRGVIHPLNKRCAWGRSGGWLLGCVMCLVWRAECVLWCVFSAQSMRQ